MESALIIAGLSFIILRIFQWTRKMQMDMTAQNLRVHKDNAQYIKSNARLEAQLETSEQRRISATRAATYYKTASLEAQLRYEQLLDK